MTQQNANQFQTTPKNHNPVTEKKTSESPLSPELKRQKTLPKSPEKTPRRLSHSSPSNASHPSPFDPKIPDKAQKNISSLKQRNLAPPEANTKEVKTPGNNFLNGENMTW